MRYRTALWASVASALVAVFLASDVHAQTLEVTIRKAPVRSGPGAQTNLVTHVMEGDVLELVDVDGLWYIVRVPDTQQVGYIHSALVKRVAGSAPTSAPRSPAPPPRTPAAAPMSEPCAPPPPPPPSRRTTPPPPPRRSEAEPLPNTQPSVDPSLDDAPWESRGLGLGMRTGWGTLGDVAFNLRTWGDTVGFSLDVSNLGSIEGLDWSRLQTQPSLLFNIGPPITLDAVYLQPYAGGGANTIWHRGALFDNQFDVGMAVFGGLDIGFMAVPNLTVSFDLGYVSDDLWSTCSELCAPSSFNDGDVGVTLGIDWYFK